MGKEGEGVHVVTSGVFGNLSTVFLLITELIYLSCLKKKLLIVLSEMSYISTP